MDDLRDGWPEHPYKGLEYYSAADRRLFSGRLADIEGCIHRLTSPETRILLLHGHTGCGKSSFLRAGLIPELELAGVGYTFLHDENDAPIFIRSGRDPLSRIAEEIYRFASTPLLARGPKGPTTLDLGEAKLGKDDLASYVKECHKPRRLRESLHLLSTKLPFTLVIVLDQAEEVITLDDGEHLCKRRFFRFIKEFSTVNFPIKFVIALRSDYSGLFVELGQTAGSIELSQQGARPREAPAVPADVSPLDSDVFDDRPFKPDIKLFLLRELASEEVTTAILLPTSTAADDGKPFERYRFRYEEGVAAHITADLFKASSTAVLPAMQLTCRDLYESLPKFDGANSDQRRISEHQYKLGGYIAGPIDRHISKSLRESFAQLPVGQLGEEEIKWREVLCRFVRGESDGTVRTRVLGVRELREIAGEHEVRADIDAVVNHLTKSETLLLRSVPAAKANEGLGLSLGHDFIGMVLVRWKQALDDAKAERQRAEEDLRLARLKAEEEIRKERVRAELELQREKQKIARIKRLSLIAASTIALSIAAVALIFVLGMRREAYQVLLNRAKHAEREDLPVAMLTSAQATTIARRYWKLGDDQAEQILARILAGQPERIHVDGDATNPRGEGLPAPLAPLTRSARFGKIRGDRAFIGSDKGTDPFDLLPFAEGTPGYVALEQSAISETSGGTVLLARSFGRQYQLYVIPADKKARAPLDAAYFLQRIDSSGAQPFPKDHESLAIQLNDGIVLVSAIIFDAQLTHGQYWVRAFAFNEERQSFELTPRRLDGVPVYMPRTLGLVRPLPATHYLIVPTMEKNSNDPALLKYDLLSDKPAERVLAGVTQKGCNNDCTLRWIPNPDSSSALLSWGVSKEPGGQSATNEYSQSRTVGRFDRLVMIDLASNRVFDSPVRDLLATRARCDPQARTSSDPSQPVEGTTDRIFITERLGNAVVGLVNNHSADLVETDGINLSCLGTLLFEDDLVGWSASRDGSYLLGYGLESAARWNMRLPFVVQAQEKQRSGTLVEDACKSRLRLMLGKLSADELSKLTGMPDLPEQFSKGLCPADAVASVATLSHAK